jgi:hypothetical protein
MRALLPAIGLSVLTLLPSSSYAGDRLRQITVTPNTETYRGYYIDYSEVAGRQNFGGMADALRRQLDIVERVGLSPRVLQYFKSIPIVVDEVVCPADLPHLLACFGPSTPLQRAQRTSRVFTAWKSEEFLWENPDVLALAEDTQSGVVWVRPLVEGPQDAVMLHELLHAYHAHIMPRGYQNPDVLLHYKGATSKQLYPADACVLKNERELFAVTASVFLYGKSDKEPFTRSKLREKQPDYFKYLVGLFGVDPDDTPVASRTLPMLVQKVHAE